MKHWEEVIIKYDKRVMKLEQENERLNRIIDELKELVIALWHNDKARFLNKEQIDLLNNTVFGNDEEDLGDDKE